MLRISGNFQGHISHYTKKIHFYFVHEAAHDNGHEIVLYEVAERSSEKIAFLQAK